MPVPGPIAGSVVCIGRAICNVTRSRVCSELNLFVEPNAAISMHLNVLQNFLE
jgi:hypothetical protein